MGWVDEDAPGCAVVFLFLMAAWVVVAWLAWKYFPHLL